MLPSGSLQVRVYRRRRPNQRQAALPRRSSSKSPERPSRLSCEAGPEPADATLLLGLGRLGNSPLGGHDDSMRLLVLGGTWFVGHAIVTAAESAGWVTTFNRGTSNPFPAAVFL
ncbi:hypothetical protein MILUP08_45780 [Micromonospora lupini str. Lupac 08]|uniref:Uncharacterized protein n=1 Tax=Micromonospora lupini str. Lupac 08 TaxID=1150864 RepID=I0LAP0_9ACTN|nr:hypothetical protein MILUP08_45780 [Micromonospora lupini str. Lupac 08]